MRNAWAALLIGMAALAGCVHREAAGRSEPAPIPVKVIHVDRHALEGGDGSAQHPYDRLVAALSALHGEPAEVRLHTGEYTGPLELHEGVRLVGTGAVLIHADGEFVIDATGGALENVIIQGGQTGLRVRGSVLLQRVTFSGQRAVAIDVQSGALTAEHVTLEASVSETVGVKIAASTRARLSGLISRGPYRRGVEVDGGELVLISGDFQDAVTAVHVNSGRAQLTRVQSRGGRGPAIFIGEASAQLDDVAVFGHEYGLLAGPNSHVEAREFLSIHAERAGAAFAQATATIKDVTVVESGTFAGLQLVNSQVRVQNFRVHGAQTAGVVVRGGSAKLEDGVVTRTTAIDDSSGDGVLVRSGEAELTSVLISDSEGAGVLSGNAAKVTLRDVIVDRAKQGGVVTDYKGSLRADSVVIRNARQAALVAVEGGRISGDAITVEGSTDDVAWAECAADSAIQITRLTSQLVPRQADCVRLTR